MSGPEAAVTAAPRPIGWRDHLLGLALCALYVAVLLPTSRDLGMSRDESFYVIAAEHYGGWLRHLADDWHGARTPEAIDQGWEYNHEHPPLFKLAFALCYLAQQKWHVFPIESMSFRFPGMVSAGLLLWLIYVFGARAFDRRVGLFAAVAFALFPRIFYHSHLDCFDVPITFMLTLVTYCYWRSLNGKWIWILWTGVTYGLALATKHNSWILPGILLVHWLWMLAGEIRARRKGEKKDARVVPWWLLAMVLIGPPIFFGMWPWLWVDPWPRLKGYVGFHMHHEYYNIAYFWFNYFRPPFPISYPFVMTLYTVPATSLLLALAAIGARARALLPPYLMERVWPSPASPSPAFVEPDRRRTDILLIGCLFAPILVIALPSTPIFGGTKHWFPAYPFIAIYAGYGFSRVADALRERLGERLRRARYAAAGAAVGLGALLLAPSLIETAHSHPFGLSHYGFFAGGVPGSADRGMNRQFWGFTTGSLLPFFREHMPDGGSLFLCDTTWWAFDMFHRDGTLPPQIRAAATISESDFALVHIEHHFVEVDFQIWEAYGTVQPAYVLTYDGVPIVNVYENPRRRARHHW